MKKKKPSVGVVSGRDSFIKHIQRVEAYVNGPNHNRAPEEPISGHPTKEDTAEYAGFLYDSFSKDKSEKIH